MLYRKKLSQWVLFLFVCIIISGIGIWVIQRDVPVSKLISPFIAFIDHADRSDIALKKIVDDALRGTTGHYSIAIKNLRTGETYYRNEHRQYQSASLYKLWVMATAYQQIERGVLKENAVVAADIADLNKTFDIASEEAEMKEGKIIMTVDESLRQMITISHNYAALLLSDKVQLSKVSKLLDTYHFRESAIDQPPHTTAYDMMVFLEKLYNGEFTNQMYTQKMISLLKQQKLNNKLPKNLPKDVIIAHKTGELNGFSHDAGIVFIDDNPYIIVVLSESDLPTAAEERIADISKGVYDYFVSKQVE